MEALLLFFQYKGLIRFQYDLAAILDLILFFIISQKFMVSFPLRFRLEYDFSTGQVVEYDQFFLFVISLLCKHICIFSLKKFNRSLRDHCFLFAEFDQFLIERVNRIRILHFFFRMDFFIIINYRNPWFRF